MSDLHLEMERWRLGVPGWADFLGRHRAVARHPARGPVLNGIGQVDLRVDLVVLAGDIHNGYRGVIYADQVARYLRAPVVMVAGNHEYYHHDVTTLLPALRAASEKTAGRVQFLENAVARFEFAEGALNVLGCTLWTDYLLNGPAGPAMSLARQRMNDHHFIELDGLGFTPEHALRMHERSRAWLHKTLAALHRENPVARNVIVTHHAPSATMLGKRGGVIAPAYGSDLLVEFAPWRPAVWVHGHTHYRHDSVEEGVRVVSAPRGYVTFDGESALAFAPGLVEINHPAG